MLCEDQPFCTHDVVWYVRCKQCEIEIINGFTQTDIALILDELKSYGKASAIRYIRDLQGCGLRQGLNLFETFIERNNK